MRNKGMSTLEYAVFIAILVTALVGISYYIKQAVCGKLREVGDTFGYGRQYEPPEVTVP